MIKIGDEIRKMVQPLMNQYQAALLPIVQEKVPTAVSVRYWTAYGGDAEGFIVYDKDGNKIKDLENWSVGYEFIIKLKDARNEFMENISEKHGDEARVTVSGLCEGLG